MSNKEIKDAIILEVDRYNKLIDLQSENLNYLSHHVDPSLLMFIKEVVKTAEVLKDKEFILDSLHRSLNISNNAIILNNLNK